MRNPLKNTEPLKKKSLIDKHLWYGDEIVVKKGKFKGMFGMVKQEMPNGLFGVKLSSGRYTYFERKYLEKLK